MGVIGSMMYLLKPNAKVQICGVVIAMAVVGGVIGWLLFSPVPPLAPPIDEPNTTETPEFFGSEWLPTPTPTPDLFVEVNTTNETPEKTMSAAEMHAAGMYGRGGGGGGSCPPCDSCCPPCPPIPELPTIVYGVVGLVFGAFCGRLQRKN